MSKPFNKLTNPEAERLALLLEELGEAQQAIGKILRHGYQSTHPNGGPDNRALLENELGDVLAAIQIMTTELDISQPILDAKRVSKLVRVKKYLHHN